MQTPMMSAIIFLSLMVCVTNSLNGCSDTISQTTSSYFDPEVNGIVNKHTTEIQLTNLEQKFCIFSQGFKTNITVRLVDQYYIYENPKLGYYIPRKLGVECPVKQETDDCQKHCGTSGKETNGFEKCDSKPPPDTVKNGGIYKERVCKASPGGCNVWYLNVYSTARAGRDFYRVHKCSGSEQISVVEVVVYQESKPPQAKNLTFDPRVGIRNENYDGTVLKFRPKSFETVGKDFCNKCFLEDDKGRFAVVDRCDDDHTEIPGIIGEIKCNKSNMADYCDNCQFSPSLLKVNRDDATSDFKVQSTCNLTMLDYEKYFEDSKLPQKFDDYRIEQRADAKFGHFQVVYDRVYFSLTMDAKLEYTPFVTREKCSLQVNEIHDLRGARDSKGAHFSVFANASQPTHIITECDRQIRVPSRLTQQTTNFFEYIIYFNPEYEFVDTFCNISCGDDRRRIRIIGHFDERQPTVQKTGIQVGAFYEVMVSICDVIKGWGSQALDQVIEVYKSIKNGIESYLSDPKIIIACIIMILFTVYAVFHCCFSCVKSPIVLVYKGLSCCCSLPNLSKRSKKQKIWDDV